MEISRTTTALLATLCVAAGAGGTYLAVRGETRPAGAGQQIEAQATPAAAPVVAESEGIIEEPGTIAPAPQPVGPAVSRPASATRPTPIVARPAPSRPQPALRAPEPATVEAPAVAQTSTLSAPIEPAAVSDNQASRNVALPGPIYDELVLPAASVIGLQLESPVTSERAQVEDSVVARVTRDVRVADRLAIPSGARAFGEVTLVERGGKLKERARLGVRFTSIVLADGTRLPIQTETIFREGDAPGRQSAAKIGGGAIGGAILGGIFGGAKGAAIGGSLGAGAGTAVVMTGDRSQATLSAGTPFTVRLEEPVIVTVER